VKKRRNNDLLALQNAASLHDHRRFIGQRVEVLVEGPSKNAWKQDANGPVQLTGRSRTDHIVVFDGDPRLAGQTMQIQIEDATSFTLYGESHAGNRPVEACCEMPTPVRERIELPLIGG
jgi:tRNA-2-methylthio-N6-dimethylallyladenosine synthase